MNINTINTFILDELNIRNGCCCYCGRKMTTINGHIYQFTIDHVFPKSNGGTNHYLNKLPCCLTCNHLKAGNSLDYFLSQIETRIIANIGNSKCSMKRWKHTHSHIVLIMLSMEKYKEEILRHRKYTGVRKKF